MDAQREHVEAELHGASRRHRDHAILVGERRVVHRIVFDVQLARPRRDAEAVGLHQRREARIETGPRRRDRQQLPIPPEILRPRADVVARHTGRLNRVVVVGDLERAEALVADEQRFGGEAGPAHPAAQTGEMTHDGSIARSGPLCAASVRRGTTGPAANKSPRPPLRRQRFRRLHRAATVGPTRWADAASRFGCLTLLWTLEQGRG